MLTFRATFTVADKVGFEPTVGLSPRQVNSLLPSTILGHLSIIPLCCLWQLLCAKKHIHRWVTYRQGDVVQCFFYLVQIVHYQSVFFCVHDTLQIVGTGYWNRTNDIRCVRTALYQSELSQHCLKWSGMKDLNLRPLGPKPSAATKLR